jgi:predicted ATPase
LRRALQERLKPLRPQGRELLMRAAVIGLTFDVDVLAEFAGQPATSVRATLRAACRLQLVEAVDRTGGRFQFRHALTRDAIYSELLAERLRPLHREFATALERLAARRKPDVEELAFHWWAAGDAARAAHYNEVAGDRAAGVHAREEALIFYRRALDPSSRRSAERGRVERKIAALEARATAE